MSLSLAIWYAGEMHLGHETQMWFIGSSSSKSGTFASGFQLVKTWKLVPFNLTFFLNDYSSSFLFLFSFTLFLYVLRIKGSRIYQ